MHQKAPVPKRTLGQKTEDRLMKFILDEPIRVGEKIPNEYELTELFKVGRSTVREAVKGLVSRGVLEVRRGDGTYVISTSYMENDVLGFIQNIFHQSILCLLSQCPFYTFSALLHFLKY